MADEEALRAFGYVGSLDATLGALVHSAPKVSNFSEILSPNLSGNAAHAGGPRLDWLLFRIQKYIDISITTARGRDTAKFLGPKGTGAGNSRKNREEETDKKRANIRRNLHFQIPPATAFWNMSMMRPDRKKFYSDLFSSFNKTRVAQSIVPRIGS